MPSDPRPFSFYKWSIVTMMLSHTDTVIYSRWPWSKPLETFKNFENFETFEAFETFETIQTFETVEIFDTHETFDFEVTLG